jgi:purine-binding chemotaxis protein CheW
MPLDERIAVAADDELELSPDEVRRVLEERARRLAQAYSEAAESTAERVQLITFSRGARRYAVELGFLTEIRPLAGWTPVPGTPEFYEGVIQVRGEIIALLDVVTLFTGERGSPATEQVAVVVSAAGTVLGLLADTVDDVHDVGPEHIHPPLATFSSARERFVKAMVEDGPAIVDVEKLLADERLWVRHDTNE